jgi:glucose-1-phosphate thymidylyltransferase
LLGDSFLVLNGDRIVESSIIDDVWETHQISDNPVLAITQAATPSRYGVVDMNEEFAKGITEQPRPESVTSEFINAGVYAFTPGVFSAIRALDVQALTDVLTSFIDDKRLRAVRYDGLWADVSEPWDLLAVNDSLLAYHGPSDRGNQTAQIDASAVVSDDAVLIGPGVIVENAVILSDVTIDSGVVVTDCIVGANTTLGANTTIEGGNADVVLDDTVYHEVSFGGLIGDNVSIGGNVTITPGTIIGNDTIIKSGASVSGRIPANSHVQRG